MIERRRARMKSSWHQPRKSGRALAIARGTISRNRVNGVWFTSMKSMAEVLSDSNSAQVGDGTAIGCWWRLPRTRAQRRCIEGRCRVTAWWLRVRRRAFNPIAKVSDFQIQASAMHLGLRHRPDAHGSCGDLGGPSTALTLGEVLTRECQTLSPMTSACRARKLLPSSLNDSKPGGAGLFLVDPEPPAIHPRIFASRSSNGAPPSQRSRPGRRSRSRRRARRHRKRPSI
jgi:hypothetical protein